MGSQALYNDNSPTGGSQGGVNVAIGYQALYDNTTGYDNVAVGHQALWYNSTTTNNVALGAQAGSYYNGYGPNQTSSNSIYLGSGTDALADGDTNETVIGYNAVGNGSNTVTLGNTSVVSTILEGNIGIGTFMTINQLTVNGAVGIGTANSSYVRTVAPAGGMIVQGNVGIGTTTPQTSLSVVGGNVGIGTWTAAGGNLIVNGGGNVGIGSAWPGQRVDVNGTVRMTGLTLTGNGAGNGYVMVGNNVGVGTWMPASTLATSGSGSNYWSLTGGTGNVGISTTNTVGIGTTSGVGAGLVVMNGNVGIGTWVPKGTLQVGNGTVASADALIVNNGPQTAATNSIVRIGAADITTGSSGANNGTYLGMNSAGTFTGDFIHLESNGTSVFTVTNVGTSNLVSLTMGNGVAHIGEIGIADAYNSNISLDEYDEGNTGLITNGFPGDGEGLLEIGQAGETLALLSNNIGIGTTLAANLLDVAGGVSIGKTYAGYKAAPTNGLLVQGNVGIGTTTSQTSLSVVGGNVGIGTWAAAGGNLIVNGGGNVGIGSAWPGQRLDVNGTIRMTGLTLTGNGAGNGYVMVGNALVWGHGCRPRPWPPPGVVLTIGY